MRTFEQNLAEYAKLAVRVGVNVQPGQELIVGANTRDAELARLIVAEAYKAGAKYVFVLFSDDECHLNRFLHGSDDAMSYAPSWYYNGVAEALKAGAARLAIYSEDPALLKSIDPKRTAAHGKAMGVAARPVGELVGNFEINWCVISGAHPGWAKMIFPNETQDTAVEKLWDAIFTTSKVYEPDPVRAWTDHANGLEKRMDWLNSLGLESLHFKGPGTDLKVGLVKDHIWVGGWGVAKNGVKCSPNIPTEEVFTMPHRDRVNGTVTATKPLSVRGQVISGFSITFKDGVAVDWKADNGLETLSGLLETDEGAKRLGEVALVPASSGVSRTGLLFYNGLYDENAASHIALGRCYAENLKGCDDLSEDEKLAAGANDSFIHEDWMIGSDQVDVDGILLDGSTRPLMVRGEWVDPV